MPEPATSINIFISYAHEDRELCERLIAHLSNLRRQGIISDWYDRQIGPGQVWEVQIQERLASAKIILLLVSADFMASDYVNDVEVATAMARHNAKEAIVIPVILSPCDWTGAPFSELQALPDCALPVTTWPNQAEAWLNVVNGIRRAVENLSVLPAKRGRVRVDQRMKVSRPGVFRYLLDRYLPSLHRLLSNLGTLSKPPETDVLNNYLRDARANIENDIRHKTYIPLAGKEVSSTPLQGGPGTDPFVPPVQQVIRQVVGLERGGDSASAQIAAVNRTSHIIRNIIKTLLRSIEPLVLLGDPGTGKTMTLQQTAMVLFDSEIKRVFPIVTLYVRLGEFYVEGPVGPEEVWSYVKASVSPQISPYLDALDSTNRLIVLFDGMDEMSRERYGEHTEALSLFAASRRGRTKALFSCRITDFSPKFMHRRLVLLPFNHEQISLYLKRYIPSFPITIEGQAWSLRRLVRELVRGSLPMEATNPFVLWLLCYQLQQKGSWPASRVELLRYYIEQNFFRKSEDLEDEEGRFPPVDQALSAWSLFAYTITSLNRGAAIAVRTLVDASSGKGIDVEQMIRIGKRCGVLQESMSGEERQIRFEHHRFQEFFTALFIKESGAQINWLEKLDAPRWQETMVNVILMGGGEDAIRTLAEAIEAEVDGPISALVDATKSHAVPETKYEEQFWTEKRANVVSYSFSRESETLVADRIELASRIVRQAGSSSAVKAILTETLKKAVNFLAEYGNPITQVKMMRACQNVPSVDLIEVLQGSLKSSINWVRNQALIIVSSSNRGAVAVGSHFASQLGYDLANGQLPVRFTAYCKAAVASKRARNWWCLTVATFAYLVNFLLLISVAAVLYLFTWAGLEINFSFSINGKVYIAICAILATAAIGLAVKFDLGRMWMAILACAAGTVFLSMFLLAAQRGIGTLIFAVFALFVLGAVLTTLLGVPLAMGIHFLALSIYLGATAPLTGPMPSLRTYFAAAWRNCGYREVLTTTAPVAIGGVLLSGVGGFALYVIFNVGSWINRASHLPFSSAVNLILIVCAVGLVTAVIVWLIRRDFSAVRTVLKYMLIALLWLLFFGWGMQFVLRTLDRLTQGSVLMGILAILMVLLIGIGVFYTLWLFRRRFQFLVVWRRKPPTATAISPDYWKMQLTAADADLQQILLAQTNHQTLGLRADQFLLLLEEVADSIELEPALSTYWDKRDRLEQVLKQERQG